MPMKIVACQIYVYGVPEYAEDVGDGVKNTTAMEAGSQLFHEEVRSALLLFSLLSRRARNRYSWLHGGFCRWKTPRRALTVVFNRISALRWADTACGLSFMPVIGPCGEDENQYVLD